MLANADLRLVKSQSPSAASNKTGRRARTRFFYQIRNSRVLVNPNSRRSSLFMGDLQQSHVWLL